MKHNKTSIVTVVAFITLLLTSCGEAKTGFASKGKGGEDANQIQETEKDSSYENGEKNIRLKDRSLIIKSFTETVGVGKHYDFMSPDDDIFEKFGTQFGDAGGLSFGETFSDVKNDAEKKNGYFLALNIVADNAGKVCAMESNLEDEKCKCESKEDAEAMLSRAFPHLDFSSSVFQDQVSSMSELCEENRSQAIAAVLSSLLFAIRH